MTATLLSRPASTVPAETVVDRPARVHVASRLWSPANVAIELTVVVPFYNPGPALRRTVERLVACLRAERIRFEVIAVSDGSTDGSEQSLADIPEARVVVSPENQGKGAALHLGFAAALGSWVGFVDADGDIDPQHLVDYLRIARDGGHAGVYADKRHAASTSGSSRFRKLVSVFYSTLVTVLFLLGVRDTQTGCKVLRRDVLADLLPRMCETRFAFDLELFVAAKAAGIEDFVGAPVRLEERVAGSTVTGRSILRTIRDTFVIFGRLHLSGQYEPPAPADQALLRATGSAQWLERLAQAA
ncbi:glycosyltransferase family 2 protein [Jidongwangia harbinensis]|uniref:glycosyltransferase family 2 protein n=1 Tax=Jidongwangia harbinensis TaxID=2878561 RepID=UPI001CD98F88|nr:glycosyltransferase family 2 protein [Jidongwangia harbinensis]MCA2213966.1 glycosyltransferase family 2 protein [Jidongwangia harbinensis]